MYEASSLQQLNVISRNHSLVERLSAHQPWESDPVCGPGPVATRLGSEVSPHQFPYL